MPTRFVTGDLFALPLADGLAHGCNCAGAMGRGIAVEFRRRFPAMYRDYRARCLDGSFALGDVFFSREAGRALFCLGTQRSWRSKAELWAIRDALAKSVSIAEAERISRLGLPRIGAGLGGLPWADVRSVVEDIGRGTQVELVVVELE